MKIFCPLIGFLFLLNCMGCATTPPSWSYPQPNKIYPSNSPEGVRENILTYISTNYIDKIDIDIVELAGRADLSISEIIANLKLDSLSRYISAEEYLILTEDNDKGDAAIGIGLEKKNKDFKVIEVFGNSPANLAGIKHGEFLTAIDAQTIAGLDLRTVIKSLRGEPNQEITISVRPQRGPERTVTMQRQLIEVPVVEYSAFENIGYIRIRKFNAPVLGLVKQALSKLKALKSPPITGLVLDIRNNPGGLLSESIRTADLFIENGNIVTIKGRADTDITRYSASRKTSIKKIPMIVLVNKSTASGAEIFAAALQHYRYALLLGAQTNGAGTVQSVIPLRGGRDGILRITTHRIHVAGGNSLESKGLVPDINMLMGELSFGVDGAQIIEAINILNSPQYNTLINASLD